MPKSKAEKKPVKTVSPYAAMPSTPSTQGTYMTDDEPDATLKQVSKKLSITRNLYLTQDNADDSKSMDLDPIPKKTSTKKMSKVCYTRPAKAKRK